jgi:hypothetical protein
MRIIVLEGPHNTGKTSTLNILFHDVLASGGVFSPRLPLGGDPNDFTSEGNYLGQRVAIYTMGDYSSYLNAAIYDFNSRGIDLLICALSTNSAMSWANSAINRFPNVRHPKTLTAIITTRSIVNRADASILFSLI